MDTSELRVFLPIAVLALTGLIALVKVKARADQTFQDMVGARKDLDRLEKEAAAWSRTTVKLVAQQEQADKNITKLWAANEGVQAREDRARDRLDERFTQLRDRFSNGHPSFSEAGGGVQEICVQRQSRPPDYRRRAVHRGGARAGHQRGRSGAPPR